LQSKYIMLAIPYTQNQIIQISAHGFHSYCSSNLLVCATNRGS
jgi:hypothetical protein